jgi:peptidoglycan biosynthesis protein MviN/MurJ (putative lipid II flippase)
MNVVLTLLGCLFIFLSSMGDPEWLEYLSWFFFFILACWQNRLHQKKFKKIYAIRKLLLYCTVAAIFGFVTAGLLQNGAHRALEWLTKTASIFMLAMIVNYVAKVVEKRDRKNQ